MTDDPKRTTPTQRILLAVAKTKSSAHGARVAAAAKTLTEAEARLKVPGAKPKRFLASFRLKDAPSPTKGTYAERREHLIARIEALNGTAHHVATSSWSMLTYHQTSTDVLAALRPAIDETIDYLEVVQTGGPVHAGVSKLKA
jgi:hypothetical protein